MGVLITKHKEREAEAKKIEQAAAIATARARAEDDAMVRRLADLSRAGR